MYCLLQIIKTIYIQSRKSKENPTVSESLKMDKTNKKAAQENKKSVTADINCAEKGLAQGSLNFQSGLLLDFKLKRGVNDMNPLCFSKI